MKIFLLQTPICSKLETVIEAYLDTIRGAGKPAWSVAYLDYEPDAGYIFTDKLDGVVAIYGFIPSFPSGTWKFQDSESNLIVDCYGFGDPIQDETDPLKYAHSTREAQNRAQILTTLSYRGIMDAKEVAGTATTEKWYDSDVDIKSLKPVSILKGKPIGAMESKRAVCVYRSTYKFELEEEPPLEPLGENYAGLESLHIPPYRHGTEPD